MMCWAMFSKLLSKDPLFLEPELGEDIILYNEDNECIFKSIEAGTALTTAVIMTLS